MSGPLAPYHLWAMFLSELAIDPEMQGRFTYWVAAHHPEQWGNYAASRGKVADDPELIIDCAMAGSRALMMALSAELDRLNAVIEARRIMGEL